MKDLSELLAKVDDMTIPELEQHIRERSLECDRLRLEQAMLTPHLDKKWTIQQARQSKPGPGQRIDIGGIRLG